MDGLNLCIAQILSNLFKISSSFFTLFFWMIKILDENDSPIILSNILLLKHVIRNNRSFIDEQSNYHIFRFDTCSFVAVKNSLSN